AGPDARVQLDVKNLPPPFARGARLVHYRIDRDDSNSYAAWLAMGSPIAPNDGQRAELLKAAQLSTLEDAGSPRAISHGKAALNFILPRQGVSLIVLTPVNGLAR